MYIYILAFLCSMPMCFFFSSFRNLDYYLSNESHDKLTFLPSN